MPTADLHRRLIAIVAALTLQACTTIANLADAPFEISEDYANNVVRYTVQRGDRLSDIALEFTGNLNTWLPIAEHNGITDPKALRVGSQIEIPTALIPGYDEERRARRKQLRDSGSKPGDSALLTPASPEEVVGKEVSEVPDTMNDSSQTDVSSATMSAARKSVTETPPINAEQNAQLMPEVRVVGTYYPKGVYARPTLDSRLMMRVAPGSDFALVEQVNGWYRIETDSGQGFLRARDGRIVDAAR